MAPQAAGLAMAAESGGVCDRRCKRCDCDYRASGVNCDSRVSGHEMRRRTGGHAMRLPRNHARLRRHVTGDVPADALEQ
jgi:hypothetical protein